MDPIRSVFFFDSILQRALIDNLVNSEVAPDGDAAPAAIGTGKQGQRIVTGDHILHRIRVKHLNLGHRITSNCAVQTGEQGGLPGL